MNNTSIEIYGLSGAGKSTIQKKCLKDSEIYFTGPFSIKKVYIYISSIILILRMFFFSPKSVIELIKSVHGRSLLLKLGLRSFGVCYKKIFLKKKIYFLKDSGNLMPIITSILNSNWKWNLKIITMILNSIELPNKIIYLSVTPIVAYKRCLDRDSNINLNINAFKNAYQTCEFIYNYLVKIDKDVLIIDNDGDELEAIQCSQIKRFIS